MTLDFLLILVTAMFASQIVVCSFVSAWRFSRAEQLAREKYPPAEYPRLYPLPPKQMQREHRMRMTVRVAIGVAAAAVLAIDLLQGIGATRLATHMIFVAMAQVLPTLLFFPQHLRLARALRDMPAPAVRSAELKPWRLTDFVSPGLIAAGIITSALSLVSVTWFHFHSISPHSMPMSAYSFVINALLLARMLYVLLTPIVMARPDPYMTAEDVFLARQRRLRMLFRAGTVLGAYVAFMQLYAAGYVRFDYAYLAMGVSLMCQMLSLRMTQMITSTISERDLAPYRAEAAGE
jgi:hypothetical protein